ncbi:MAG: tetratricopeptide repeat protein [Candidatus Neomarinimicrobiota bacterium]
MPLKSFLIYGFISGMLFSQDPEELLNRGNLELNSGNLELAEELFNSALKLDPSFAPAIKSLSKLSLHRGDLKKANEYSIEAVQKDEDFRKWSNVIAKISENIQNGNRNVQQGLFEEAIKNYELISKDHPYFPDAEFYKGLTRFRQKDIEGAAEYFKKTLDIYSEHKKARKGLDNVTKQFLNAGNKSYKRGDVSKATDYYEKALEFDSNFYLAYFQLGVLQKKQGQSKKAIESLQKVIDIKPDHDKTWFTLGTAYEADGNNQEAIIHYNKAIEINPGYSKAYGNLGKLYTDIGNFNDAEDKLKTVIQIDPEYADGFMRLGILYLEQEKFIEAIENLSYATKLDKKDFNKFFNLASAYNNIKEWDKAVLSAQSCIDIKKRFGGGWLELGIAEMGKKNKTRAKRHFEEARKDRDWRKMAERKIDEINNPAKYEK